MERISLDIGVFFRYFGPGIFIAVGYMDPGNWATDIAAGSHFGYSLLSIIVVSGAIGMVLQYLSIKLTIVTGKDLATLCAQQYSSSVRYFLWILSEIGIIACDLAEVLGMAIALNLLFHIPILLGSIITILDTFLILFLMERKTRYLEIFLTILITTITFCFLYNIFLHPPNTKDLLHGLVPPVHLLVNNSQALLVSAGILGATVMPHNLYLHGYILNRKLSKFSLSSRPGKSFLLRIFSLDSNLSLILAFLINALILILSASQFHTGNPVDTIQQAYELLSPTDTTAASILFAIALLASGQNATLTGTIAAQAIMDGFLRTKISPTVIRLITRLLALIPIILFLYIAGDTSVDRLLIWSQVVLSLQLPFVAIPLLRFTNSKKLMGRFANRGIFLWLCYFIIVIILILNILLIFIK